MKALLEWILLASLAVFVLYQCHALPSPSDVVSKVNRGRREPILVVCDYWSRANVQQAMRQCTARGGVSISNQWRESCFTFDCSHDERIER